jgi:hypothetical protein
MNMQSLSDVDTETKARTIAHLDTSTSVPKNIDDSENVRHSRERNGSHISQAYFCLAQTARSSPHLLPRVA